MFAVVLGVTLGPSCAGPLPAMAVTLALFVAVQVAVPLWVRPAPGARRPPRPSRSVRDTSTGSVRTGPGEPGRLTVHTAERGDWILSNQTVDADGRPPGLPAGCRLLRRGRRSQGAGAGQGAACDACLDRLTTEGYRQQLVYQPAGHFWPLQWAETGLYLGASALLAGFCFWWTRRRLS